MSDTLYYVDRDEQVGPVRGATGQQLMVAQGMHLILRVVGIGLCIYAVAKLGKKPAAAELSGVF